MNDGGSGTAADQGEMGAVCSSWGLSNPFTQGCWGMRKLGEASSSWRKSTLPQPLPFCLRNPEERAGPAAHAEVSPAGPLFQAQAGRTSETLRPQGETGMWVNPTWLRVRVAPRDPPGRAVAVTSRPSEGCAFPVPPSALLRVASV